MNLGDFEEVVLLAISGLGADAYGVPILNSIEAAGRRTSSGALYVTLERLGKKGLVESREGEATSERGGKSKRYYRVTSAGIKAMRSTEATRSHLRGAKLAGGLT